MGLFLDANGEILEKRLSSVGRAGCFTTSKYSMREQEVPRGEPGEICVRGGLVALWHSRNRAVKKNACASPATLSSGYDAEPESSPVQSAAKEIYEYSSAGPTDLDCAEMRDTSEITNIAQ